MPPRQRSESHSEPTRRRPATTPKAREDQLVSLAYDLAEKQLRDGTASSQVISTLIKAGSQREKLEQERLNNENHFLRIRAENLASQQRSEEMYSQAMAAFREYAGHDVPDTSMDDEY